MDTLVKHYLLTIPLTGANYAHMYVITKDERVLKRERARLVDEAEKRGLIFWPSVILQTELSKLSSFEIVQSVAARAKKGPMDWKSISYCSIAWAMPFEDPDNNRLLELH